MSMDRVTEVLTKHGWPPATLTVVILLAVALYVLYQDHREVQGKWEDLARDNLEANMAAANQRKQLHEMMGKTLKVQEGHLSTIKDMEAARLKQSQLDQQLTAAAVHALRQIGDQVNVQLQMVKPDEVLGKK